MLSKPIPSDTLGIAISPAWIPPQQTRGYFGATLKLPLLNERLFDEMFRLVELRSIAANQPTAETVSVVHAKQDQSGGPK